MNINNETNNKKTQYNIFQCYNNEKVCNVKQ